MLTDPMAYRLAYSIPNAGQMVGYSESVIKQVIARGDLTPRFANSKPVLLHADLVEWLESLPLDKP
jgi:hypothetical protein